VARNPFSSRGVDYGDELINLRVPRVDADPLAAFDFARASSLNGRVGAATRIVSLHTDGDELVRLAHQQSLRSRCTRVGADRRIFRHALRLQRGRTGRGLGTVARLDRAAAVGAGYGGAGPGLQRCNRTGVARALPVRAGPGRRGTRDHDA
jgi:hypothetical protein